MDFAVVVFSERSAGLAWLHRLELPAVSMYGTKRSAPTGHPGSVPS